MKKKSKLNDKLAAIDAKFAVSAADLSEAIKRVGSTAQDAGVGFDELIALVTAAQQTTARGGAVIGNALKTILTRIQQPKILKQLEEIGIVINNSRGNTLSTIEILINLVNKFNKLNYSKQIKVCELLGGVYQMSITKAMFN